MRGRRQFEASIVGQRHRGEGWNTRRGAAHAAFTDQCGALTQIARIQQGRKTAAGRRDEIGVGHVARPIRKRQTARLAECMHRRRTRLLAEFGLHRWRQVDVALFEQAQDLPDRQRTRRGWRHAAQTPGLVVETQRLTHHRPVLRQIGLCEPSRIGRVALNLVGNRPGQFTVVERRFAALREVAEDRGQRGIAQHRAGAPGCPIGFEKICGGLRIEPQPTRHRVP